MQSIWTNLPEIWVRLNSKYDISDLGNVRNKESAVVLQRWKWGRGYAAVNMHGLARKVHPWVLNKFIPKPSPMFNMCDHINRNRMDPRLVNLRWSNIVLNAMNKEGVKGYSFYRNRYYPNLKLLAVQYHFASETIEWKARAVYEYWQSRAYEVIDGLCSRNMHWKFQRLILEFWMPVAAGSRGTMKWETDPTYCRLPLCGRLS